MQRAVPAVVMRGGTSRGVFFHERHLPPSGAARDALLREVLGAPDPLQPDGLGGGVSSTSKAMVLGPAMPCGEVPYTFAQIDVHSDQVDHVGNCGNLTAAVAAFAVDEGLVEAVEPTTELTLLNVNTGVRVRAAVPVLQGRARAQGSFQLPGVHRPGAAISTRYLDPSGALFTEQLPTGRPLDRIEVPGLGEIAVSVVDVTNPVAMVRAETLGLRGTESPADATRIGGLFDRAEGVRRAVVDHLGSAPLGSWSHGLSRHQPKVAALAAPLGPEPSATLVGRVVADGRMHHAFPATALLCVGAAAAVPGTLPNALRADHDDARILIAHAAGVSRVGVRVDEATGTGRVSEVEIDRTARRIMQGEVLVRR